MSVRDAKVERWNKDNAATLIEGIAKALGGKAVEHRTHEAAHMLSGTILLRRATDPKVGPAIRLHVSGYNNKDRLKVERLYPYDEQTQITPRHWVPYHERDKVKDSITISLDKPIHTIAREITWRLLDDYWALHTKALGEVERYQMERAIKRRVLDELAAIMPGTEVRGEDRLHLWGRDSIGYSLQLGHKAETITEFKLDHLRPDEAAIVLHLLNELMKDRADAV